MTQIAGMPASKDEFNRRLTEQILGGGYSPGEKLPSERALAIESRLSRPVVREVLRGLQERGLVDIQPGRGAYVRTGDSLDLAPWMGSMARQRGATPRNLAEARVMLEQQAASLAATRASDDDIELLADLVAAFDAAPTVVDRARCDLALHAHIAQASGNPVIETMFGSIALLIFELQLRSLDDPDIVRQGAPLHQVIADAIRSRDEAAAAAAMHEHVALAYRLYGDDLDVPLDVLARRRLVGLLGEHTRLEDVIQDVLQNFRSDADRSIRAKGHHASTHQS